MQNDFLNLNGKVAAVIGASSGIGRATALLLAKQGAAVVLCARRAEELAQTAALIRKAGDRVETVAGDARQPETRARPAALCRQPFLPGRAVFRPRQRQCLRRGRLSDSAHAAPAARYARALSGCRTFAAGARGGAGGAGAPRARAHPRRLHHQ